MCIYIYTCVCRLTPNLAWGRVRDKVAPLPMHERVQKTLGLWWPTIRRSRDGLGFLAPRRAAVGPSVMWSCVESQGWLFSEGCTPSTGLRPIWSGQKHVFKGGSACLHLWLLWPWIFSEREPPVFGTVLPPIIERFVEKTFRGKKTFVINWGFNLPCLSRFPDFLSSVSLFLRMRVNNWNWKWNKTKHWHPCIYRRTCKIHEEKNQLKCQNRTWKLIAIPGVWRKSMLRVYECVFCSISLLSVYMCVRIPLCSRSIAGVPSSRALPHFPPHTTCAF